MLNAALLEGIVQLASEGIISIDAEERIHLFNRGAEEIFGWSAAEVVGKPLEMLIPARYRPQHHAEHLPRFAAAHETARRMGERREVFGLRKSGEEFPAEVSISRVDVDGRRMYNAVVRDVTERRRYETALQRSNAELEQFAYVASHDLQEPLRMVASYTQLLARRYQGRLDPQADTYIRFAVEGAQRMQALIHDLLALSRVGTQGRALAPVDTGDVMAGVLRWLGPALEESGGEVAVGALPTVTADAGQLQQLFQNLVANALKFRRPDAAPRVEVTAAREGAAWRFTVRDNGIGFEPEFADQIFVVFQRLHTRAEYPGTGVGLAICKKIVERHGGTIRAESAPGAGAAFHFTIPDPSA
ncbi:PAS domain-containing sensor histidine kinase [Roseisolibacter sp. H3M3-2]|uniref:sensor histidine kinase n=1 Tax=Roseisolibacter sp. H3M3-2 TaxID=3031323 RepID=UPI0023D9FC93|nr:PAS domain-containing sensor histidine kinase [Roseisolibacter sp. H3M3-2]MDF1502214.1 ATP-binding protein [Roseisolibacter sp. H3M3-2]